jgi:hypothetical protein
VGAAVEGLQSLASWALLEEDVSALLEAAVHECSRGGVTCCRSSVMRCAGSTALAVGVSSTLRVLRGSHTRAQQLMPADPLLVPCKFREEPGDAHLSTLGA